MKHYILITAGFLILMSSCISEKTVTRKYYTIEIPEEKNISLQESSNYLPGKCEVSRVDVNPLYEKNQIVNRSKSHEVTFYMYHLWAVRPADAIRTFISDYLNNKKVFESVSERYSRAIPDFRLETVVKNIEIVEENNSFAAYISMELNLLLNSNDSILVSHSTNRLEPLDKKNMNLFARSVSGILFEELEIFSGLILELEPDEINKR